MSAALYRWIGVATLHGLLITPVVAMDASFGDEMPAPAMAASTQPADAVLSPAPPADASNPLPATGAGASAAGAATGEINFNDDDPLTFHALQRITLKNLNINASADQPAAIKDPFQIINRQVYRFNDTLDRHILLPVATGYKNHVPQPLRQGVANFFANLAEPWDAVNLLLQGEARQSYHSAGRFTVNTLTTLGFGDYATTLGLTNHDGDFGQTMGKWGVRSGPFVMLPFLGPSTFRDSAGRLIDQFGRVQHYMHKNTLYWTSYGLQALDKRTQFIGVENIVQGDQYTLLRDLYLQRRQYKISGQQQSMLDDSFGDSDASFDTAPGASPASGVRNAPDPDGF